MPKKIEDRIADRESKIVSQVARIIMPHLPDSHGKDSIDGITLAKDILALISSVECGDCGGKGHTEDEYFAEDDYEECSACKGTGYRKVMVRRECSEYKQTGEDTIEPCEKMLEGCHPDNCGFSGTIRTPFSPADLLDIINGSATLVLEVEG